MSQENQPNIVRGKHDKEHPYVMISKAMLKDKSISPQSKGVLCYLLSLPDNWKTNPCQVADALGIGEDRIYTALNELIKEGYCVRTRTRNEKGQWNPYKYEFFEERLPHRTFPDVDIPDVDCPHVEKPDHTKDISKKQKKEDKEKPPPPIASSSKIPAASQPGGGGFYKNLVFKNGQGKERILTESDVIRYMLKYPHFSMDVIHQAMIEASVAPGLVNDPFSYLVSICNRIYQKSPNVLTVKEKVNYAPPLDTSPKCSYMEAKARMEAMEKVKKEKANGV